GSGISTALEGNVASVQTAALPAARGNPPRRAAGLRTLMAVEAAARAQTAIEGITVAVAGTTLSDLTDANGRFSIRGNFEGEVSIIFELPDAGGSGRITVNVPAAGTLTMHDVHVDAAAGSAIPESQDVDFDGIMTRIDCAGSIATLVSVERSPTDTDDYMVRLDTSSIHDAHGAALACEDLRIGTRASVQGTVNPDGTFGNADIEVGG